MLRMLSALTVPDTPAGTRLTDPLKELAARPPLPVRPFLEADREAGLEGW